MHELRVGPGSRFGKSRGRMPEMLKSRLAVCLHVCVRAVLFIECQACPTKRAGAKRHPHRRASSSSALPKFQIVRKRACFFLGGVGGCERRA